MKTFVIIVLATALLMLVGHPADGQSINPNDTNNVCTNCPDFTNPPVPLNGTKPITLSFDEPDLNTGVCEVAVITESPDANGTNWQPFCEVRATPHCRITFWPMEGQMHYRVYNQIGLSAPSNLMIKP